MTAKMVILSAFCVPAFEKPSDIRSRLDETASGAAALPWSFAPVDVRTADAFSGVEGAWPRLTNDPRKVIDVIDYIPHDDHQQAAYEDEALEESGYWYGQEWSDLDFDI